LLRNSSGVQQPLLASGVYETEPIGCEPGAGAFLNVVVEIGYSGSAGDLLHVLRSIEEQLGRPSRHPKNTSRTIDLDILYFGDERLDTPELQLPHPRLRERRFVLQPLADIRPDLVLPGFSTTVAELLTRPRMGSGLVCVATEW
jgi:2-amino-4-hydroxy-6-hydroxymethyldihydropteridine diphosphokinase